LNLLHFPNAKINIGLFVTEKRLDTYHNLETIFFPLPMLKDALEVLPSSEGAEASMRISGRKIEGDIYDNLVWKAFQLIRKKYPEKVSPIQVHLLKSIPMGAGLGGGSADGAFMLRLLNQYFSLEIADEVLARLALELGSDCPFFIYNTPQFAKGRGELLSPINLDLNNYSIQVICPRLHVSTSSAFSKITPKQAPFDLSQLSTLPIEKWKEFVFNDFEQPIFESYPFLAQIKQRLYDDGAIYASMSGSGSTLYGIFEQGAKSKLVHNEDLEVFYFDEM
jgi:4-diphosphocytidyl-2-C-methyl-D-erythritol kinase